MAISLVVLITVVLSPSLGAEIARSKPAYQTGVWSGAPGMTADKAVDGYKDATSSGTGSEYYKSVCAHPDTGDSTVPAEWWVDLGGTYSVDSIAVWNTYNTAVYGRLSNFVVGVKQTGQDDVICATRRTVVAQGQGKKFYCNPPAVGSGVFLRKLAGSPDQHLVTICEVQVDGTANTAPPQLNIALRKPTNQSGTHTEDSRWTSDKVVDGRLDIPGTANGPDKLINCARVDSCPLVEPCTQPAEWWVDLGQQYTVNTVIVHKSYWQEASVVARFNHFDIRVVRAYRDDTLCESYSSGSELPLGSSAVITCPVSTVGRYVRLIRTHGPGIDRISLCELEVLGKLSASYDYMDQYTSVTAANSTTVNIQWDQIPVSAGGGQDHGYLVVYWAEGSGTEIQTDIPYDSTISRHVLDVSGLSANTRYMVEIRPYRRQDGVTEYGVYYPRWSVTTSCGVPDPAQNVQTAKEITPGGDIESIKVTYELPSVTGCNSIAAVWVTYRLETEADWLRTDATTVGDPITVTVSTPGTYSLRLYVRNDVSKERAVDLNDVVVNKIPQYPVPDPTPTRASTDTTSTTSADGAKVSDTVIIVTVVVTVVCVSLAAVCITWLVLRHRRNQPAQKDGTGDGIKHTYVNTGSPDPDRGKTSLDPRDYEEVHTAGPHVIARTRDENTTAQYEAVTMETREPPARESSYQELCLDEAVCHT